MTIHAFKSDEHFTTGQVIGLSLIGLLLWLFGLMSFMPGVQSHTKRLIALAAIVLILAVLGLIIRRYRHGDLLITVIISAFVAPVYYLLHPVGNHPEWIFGLTVVAISAQWGMIPGILSALMNMTGYGIVAYAFGHEIYVIDTLTLGSFFIASAFIVGILTRHRESALQHRASMANELEETYNATLVALTQALDARDRDTEGHSERAAMLAMKIGHEMRLGEAGLRYLNLGALLHDIGKIGIPDVTLHKPGSLDEQEWNLIHKHPKIGYDILQGIKFLTPALDVVLYHHEKYDGTGYPEGLAGEAIPLVARIFTVADVYDALTSDRPYRAAFTHEEALKEIHKNTGNQFDPLVVAAFEKSISSGARKAVL